MGELLLILIPIVLADVINPVLFAVAVYTLGTSRPIVNTSALLFGFFIIYMLAGIILAIGFETVDDYFKNPTDFDYAIQFAVGILCLWFSWYLFHTTDYQHNPEFKHPEHMTIGWALFLGIQANIVGLPFALPYAVAIDRMLISGISPLLTFFALLYYNLLYIAPFAFLILIRWLYQEKSNRIFRKINRILLRTSDILLPIILLILGAYLLFDSFRYFLYAS